MKGNTRVPSRPVPEPRTLPHEVNGAGVQIEAGSLTAVEDPFVIAPFKPSSPSVELDPSRLAQELGADNVKLR